MEKKCSLIIDSCCDLPFGIIENEGVYLVKFSYFDSTGEHPDDLYQTQTPHEFYEGMRHGEEPFTSQVSIAELQKAYDWAYEQKKPAVYLAFSSALSGTYNAACLLAEQMKEEHPDFELYVVDTKLASIAEGVLIYKALAHQEQGLTARELAKWAEEALYYVHGYFMVDDPEVLRRGGRIPATVALGATKLDAKLLLGFSLDGSLSLVGVSRGRKKGVKAIYNYYEKFADENSQGEAVIVGAADCPRERAQLSSLFEKREEPVFLIEADIGTVIGCHVGPGMIAAAFWGKDRHESVSMVDRIANRVKSK